MNFLVPKCYLSLKLSSNFKIPDVLSSMTARRKGGCSTILPILHPLHSASVLLCTSPDLVYSQCPGGIKVWSMRLWATVMYTDNNISLRTDRHCARQAINTLAAPQFKMTSDSKTISPILHVWQMQQSCPLWRLAQL